jgi:hypothetical protein
MPRPMTDEERLHRGNRAKEVLENEEFQAAFEAIENELTEAWKNSPQRDAEGREKLFQALTMLSKIKQSLTSTMDTGKLALLELQHKNPTMREKAREFLGMTSWQ